jgi:16S rRNA C1402 N4-methylase RsmH
VKHAFQVKTTWKTLTKKPVGASDDEASVNLRSRSAKLRAARRVEAAAEAEPYGAEEETE